MTDNFILHWEIDNATATLATGKAESGVYHEGGFKWIPGVEKVEGQMEFTLRCDLDYNGQWECEVDATVCVLQSRGVYEYWRNDSFCFNENRRLWRFRGPFWFNFDYPAYKFNDKVTFEFRVNIISSKRVKRIVDPGIFAAPNNMSNVILKIGDEKVHVFKELLALHSPVFNTLFFGYFAEKGKEEVELKDVDYGEFVDLLHVIYMDAVVTDRSVPHILKLSDQFQIERVLKLASDHVMHSNGLDKQSLQSFTKATDLTAKLKSSLEFAKFSADMKALICERIVKLT